MAEFMEVSSHRLLNYSGTTDTRAPKGTVGTLLLTPRTTTSTLMGFPNPTRQPRPSRRTL